MLCSVARRMFRRPHFARLLFAVLALSLAAIGSIPASGFPQEAPSPPPLRCVSEHGAWCVLDGAREQKLADAWDGQAVRLSNPSDPAAALVVISPPACSGVRADQLSFRSFEHGIEAYGQDWERIDVRLRGDATCDLKILLPPFSSNPFEWAFSSGLQLIRACQSDKCDGPPVGLLKPVFELRYRAAALPLVRPVVTQTSIDHTTADLVAFCDVVGHPRAFSGRQISFVASLASDGIHAVILMDPSCKRGMNFDSSHATSAWKPVEDALFTGGPGTSDKTITARWTGILDLSGEVRGESPSLIIDSISELTVTPIEENSAR